MQEYATYFRISKNGKGEYYHGTIEKVREIFYKDCKDDTYLTGCMYIQTTLKEHKETVKEEMDKVWYKEEWEEETSTYYINVDTNEKIEIYQ